MPDSRCGRRSACCRIWPIWESVTCTSRPACRRFPAVSMATMWRTPRASATTSAASPPGSTSSAPPARMGCRILLDIVPNHMSASEHNPWWDDVLAHGPFSQFAEYFDIKLRPGQPFRLHLCSLARPYGAAIDAGELNLEIVQGRPRICHYENSWPIGPASWGKLLSASAAVPASAASCFSELERLRTVEAPGEKDRRSYGLHAVQAEEAAGERVPAGHAAGSSGSRAGRQRAIGRDAAAAVLPAARLETRGGTRQLPPLFRYRLLERHSHRAAGRFRAPRTRASRG